MEPSEGLEAACFCKVKLHHLQRNKCRNRPLVCLMSFCKTILFFYFQQHAAKLLLRESIRSLPLVSQQIRLKISWVRTGRDHQTPVKAMYRGLLVIGETQVVDVKSRFWCTLTYCLSFYGPVICRVVRDYYPQVAKAQVKLRSLTVTLWQEGFLGVGS